MTHPNVTLSSYSEACYKGKASGQVVLEGWLSQYDAPQTGDPAQVALRAFAVTPA